MSIERTTQYLKEAKIISLAGSVIVKQIVDTKIQEQIIRIDQLNQNLKILSGVRMNTKNERN